jgi:hypothetical protein
MMWGKGYHYWPRDHFSVPAETICFERAPSPNADHFCVREKGHKGKCLFDYSPDVRSYSHKQSTRQEGAA